MKVICRIILISRIVEQCNILTTNISCSFTLVGKSSLWPLLLSIYGTVVRLDDHDQYQVHYFSLLKTKSAQRAWVKTCNLLISTPFRATEPKLMLAKSPESSHKKLKLIAPEFLEGLALYLVD